MACGRPAEASFASLSELREVHYRESIDGVFCPTRYIGAILFWKLADTLLACAILTSSGEAIPPHVNRQRSVTTKFPLP